MGGGLDFQVQIPDETQSNRRDKNDNQDGAGKNEQLMSAVPAGAFLSGEKMSRVIRSHNWVSAYVVSFKRLSTAKTCPALDHFIAGDLFFM